MVNETLGGENCPDGEGQAFEIHINYNYVNMSGVYWSIKSLPFQLRTSLRSGVIEMSGF